MGSTGRASGNQAVRAVTMPDGTKITLENDLVYSRDTGHKAMPQSVVDFENKRRTAKIEYSITTMEDGTVIETNRGGKGSVGTSFFARMRADILSHNHPRSGVETGQIGGTFSPQDISLFAKFSQKTYRAVAGEGTYSITKGERFDSTMASDFAAFERRLSSAFKTNLQKPLTDKMRAEVNKLNTDYRAGKMTKSEADARFDALQKEYISKQLQGANNILVSLHDWLRNNQTKYGYTYGLER